MITSPPSAAAWLRASRCHQPGATLGATGMNNLLALGSRMDTAIRGHGGKACDPRAIASSRPQSRTGSHGHSAVASTKAPSRHLRWSEHYKLAQNWWSGAASNCRPSAFRLTGNCPRSAHSLQYVPVLLRHDQLCIRSRPDRRPLRPTDQPLGSEVSNCCRATSDWMPFSNGLTTVLVRKVGCAPPRRSDRRW